MSAVDDLHPDLASLLGTVIHGRYRVDELLGRGGMGAVFKARHLGLERDVAIKVLRPALNADETTGKRFVREAQSVSRLDHPNCVRVTDFGSTDKDIQYLVMELLEGAELEAELGAPWPAARAIATAIQILEALEHAHHFGIVHRDLKPENVFLTTDFRGETLVKLVDFGIAKLIGDASPEEQLTRQGMVFGTPRYMSPEQASGGKLDERTDLYAVGLLVYEMLAGHPPFEADEVAVLLRMQILAPPPALPPSVPPALAAVVTKLLEKTRKDRYASAREAIDALVGARATLDVNPGPGASAAAGGGAGVVGRLSQTGPTAPAPNRPASSAPAAAVPPPPAAVPPPPAAVPPPSTPTAHALPTAQVPASPGLPPVAPVNPPTLPPLGPSASDSNHLQPASSPGNSSSPNRATHPPSSSVSVSQTVPTSQTPAVHTRPGPPPDRSRPYLPWVIGAVGILVALMAFGAGQALRGHGDDDANADEVSASPGAGGVDPSVAGTAFDDDCRDGVCGCDGTHTCELDCGEHCSVRCTHTARCELELGDRGWAFCDNFGTCEVECRGDCRVTCPQGGCEVGCSEPQEEQEDEEEDEKHDKKGGKGGKKNKKKWKFKDRRERERGPERHAAKTCADGTLVCGSCE